MQKGLRFLPQTSRPHRNLSALEGAVWPTFTNGPVGDQDGDFRPQKYTDPWALVDTGAVYQVGVGSGGDTSYGRDRLWHQLCGDRL